LNVRFANGMAIRPNPAQLELNFDRRPTLKDYADFLTQTIIYGRSCVDWRGRVYAPHEFLTDPPVPHLRGTRADTIILDDIEWASQRPNS